MELPQVVNQENCNVSFVRKLFQKTDILVVVRIQISVAARSTDTLQRINDNEFRCRMFHQELLDLLFQPMLERVSHDRKMQRRRRVLGQIKESRLDALERIFETEIQNLALGCCEIPERLPLRNACRAGSAGVSGCGEWICVFAALPPVLE